MFSAGNGEGGFASCLSFESVIWVYNLKESTVLSTHLHLYKISKILTKLNFRKYVDIENIVI